MHLRRFRQQFRNAAASCLRQSYNHRISVNPLAFHVAVSRPFVSSAACMKPKGKTPPSTGGSSKPAAAVPAAANSKGVPTPTANGRGVEGDFVFGVQDLTKTLPGSRVLFANVNLTFQRGAKIGVLGLNGSGKSSLLKILAGVDKYVLAGVWRTGCWPNPLIASQYRPCA